MFLTMGSAGFVSSTVFLSSVELPLVLPDRGFEGKSLDLLLGAIFSGTIGETLRRV